MPDAPANTLYYGDNLDILRRYVKDETVDLVYLDPPFNSNADYNVLFAEHADKKEATEKSHAQIQAFKDTWQWDVEAARNFTDAVTNGGEHVAKCLLAFKTFLGQTDMLAYLAMMAPRLVELRRVLKPTGSIYLHCDPTASHYLKMLMDAVYRPENFSNEIIWRRTGSHGNMKRYAPIHDTILYYTRSAKFTWNGPRKPYMMGHVKEYFVQDAKGWKTNYYGNVLTGSGRRNGDSGKPWRGFDPDKEGRHWAVPGAIIEQIGEDLGGFTVQEKLDRLFELGFIKITKGQKWPIPEWYITPEDGVPAPDIWAFQPYTEGTVFGTKEGVDADVRWMSTKDKERLGYPTQKPVALLERILAASSNEGDVILDPFCGCGTTVAAAQKLKRKWVGIDITHLAVNLIKVRLADAFGKKVAGTYKVIGEPEDLESARSLAEADKYQFQYWALGLVGARPAASQERKGADKGIDGRLYFTDAKGEVVSIIVSVKGGHVTVPQVRDLRGVIEREEAAIGVFICIEPPTKPMLAEAADAGFYENVSGVGKSQHPRLQILTIGDLLDGKRPDLPVAQDLRSFKQAPKVKAPKAGEHPALDFEMPS